MRFALSLLTLPVAVLHSQADMCPLRALLCLLHLHLLLLLGSVDADGETFSFGRRSCPFRTMQQYLARRGVAAFVPHSNNQQASTLPSLKRPGHPRLLKTTKVPVQPASPDRTLQSTPLHAATMAPPVSAPEASNVIVTQPGAGKKRQRASMKPLEVYVIGLSHHNAAVDVRERLAIPEAQWNEASARLCDGAHDSYAAFRDATSFLERHSGLSQSDLRKNLFLLSGEDALWHLMRVAGGLDSLVVGEGQILSQVKQAYTHGIESSGSGGKVISRMLNAAVTAGKRVRSETGISKGAVSISSAAVEFSQVRSQKDLSKALEASRIAVIGAGKMSRLLMIHLAAQGIKEVTLMNRTPQRAEALAAEFPEMQTNILLMDTLWDVMRSHEVIYTSTSASGCILTKENMQENGVVNPMVLVDISVPRNVEKEVDEMPGIHSYNVDHLKEVVDRNTAMRRKQVLEAEDLLLEEMEKFRSWQFSLGAVPALMKLQEKAETMRTEELKKASKKLNNLSPKELDTVERLTKGIVNKLLHGPMSHLRATEDVERNLVALKTLKAVYEL